jgi:adenylyl cyclase-associated protein
MSGQLEEVISKLVSRLETVTARLEKVEKQIATGGGGSGAGAGAASSSGSGDGNSAAVTAFEEVVANHLPGIVENAGKIGDSLPDLATALSTLLEEHKKVLIVASKSKKPADADFMKLMAGQMAAAQTIQTLKEKAPRTSKVPNHLATVSEGIGAFNWVSIAPTPVPFIGDMIGGSEFYSNRILKDFKGKDENHVAWVQAFNGLLKDLQKFVKAHHTTGLVWKANGAEALATAASLGGGTSAAPSAPAAGGPPPPPKAGPPPPPPVSSTPVKEVATVDPSQMFAQINGGNVTGGLKKVTDDMKAKNRADRTGHVGEVAPKKAATPAKAAGAPKKGPAKTALEGNKWCIENHNEGMHEVTATDGKQTVYIYKVDNSVVKVNGKINAIILDTCKKTAVIFENAIASCEIVNCNSVKVQVNKVPSIAVDKTSGFQLFLSKDCLDAEIYTSKSDEMNVVIPNPKEGEDPIEMPIPEQFLSKVSNFKLHTESVQHTGA